MGDPFYGNGAGVQREFDFSKETPAPFKILWVPFPYGGFDLDADWWAYCPSLRRSSKRPTGPPYGLPLRDFLRR